MIRTYFHGFPASTPWDEAVKTSLATLRESDQNPVIEGPDRIETPEHVAVGEYVIYRATEDSDDHR